MLLRAREILESKRKLGIFHRPEIAEHSVFQAHGRFRIPAGNHGIDLRQCSEILADQGTLLRRHQEIQITHGFLRTAVGTSHCHPRNFGMEFQRFQNPLHQCPDTSKRKTIRELLVHRDRFENLHLRLRAEAR